MFWRTLYPQAKLPSGWQSTHFRSSIWKHEKVLIFLNEMSTGGKFRVPSTYVTIVLAQYGLSETKRRAGSIS